MVKDVVPERRLGLESSNASSTAASLNRDCKLRAVDDTSVLAPQDGLLQAGLLRARDYQTEMFEQSMRRNIIVAMDTGSGKTQIAIIRIAAELDRCPPERLVWFLAPTVALAQQQYRVIGSQLPAFQLRLLLGADNVELWSEQHLWDSVLLNVRIVVSTHKILLDALTHGFVRMTRLALLIFDEAHHCVSSHPANQIMQKFYHPLLRSATHASTPHILGLSASPTVNARPGDLEVLEQNLNAISRSPTLHRQKMLEYVYPPEVIRLIFRPCLWTCPADCGALQRLHDVYYGLDIRQDPYIVKLSSDSRASSERQLQKALLGRKTYCQDQMKFLCHRSMRLFEELGPWSVEQYLFSCIEKFKSHVHGNSNLLHTWDDEEKTYLRDILERVAVTPPSAPTSSESSQLSEKALRFIDYLTQQDLSDFAGLVFVEERATVSMLSRLLAIHPQTKDRFMVSTFVGTSNNSKRKVSIGELLHVRDQSETLDHLRSGHRNLVIATSVLEEGIDVSACNIVICFNKPATLKSFIQRRGRARKESSKLVLMVDSDDPSTIDKWRDLEDAMKNAYQDELRQLEMNRKQEEIVEERGKYLRVNSTGALLTLDNAVEHLFHFCATLPASSYTNLAPEFIISDSAECDTLSAKVILPNSLDPTLREHQGTGNWKSERYAKRDAAFEAYVALHTAGLVNDHLLPILERDSEVVDGSTAVEKRAALVEAAEQLNPWRSVAQSWEEASEIQTACIDISGYGEPSLEIVMILPRQCPPIADFILHWDHEKAFTVSIREESSSTYDLSHVVQTSKLSALLLQSVFSSRVNPDRCDFPALFVPRIEAPNFEEWLSLSTGAQPANDVCPPHLDIGQQGLVRDREAQGRIYILKGLTHDVPDAYQEDGSMIVPGAGDLLYLKLVNLPKRKDFLHSVQVANQTNAVSRSGFVYLPASRCTIDRLPFRYSRFALFIPSIMHRLELSMVAEQLCNTVLLPVVFKGLDLVVTALSASSAREGTDYQRLEFLGDSVLKHFTSITLMSEHPKWHEGYLSAKKDRLVANGRLSRAAIEVGLDQYILTKPFTGQKWRPSYVSELLKPTIKSKRQMSTKVLADVVEALVGAAYLDGGSKRALACLQVFLPEIPWLPLDQRLVTLYEAVNPLETFPPRFKELERLGGYRFKSKTLLVEAMTHPSYNASDTAMSYQRLEFLGDSVLDSIVVARVFGNEKKFRHFHMHTMRTALVNAGFLAFLCMEHSITELRAEVFEDKVTHTFHTEQSTIALHIWQFMRHSLPEIAHAQQACVERFHELRNSINNALWCGGHYPWALLARLEAPKFFSDLMESLVGAIYIDSHGCVASCEAFLDTLGVLPYLRRIVGGQVKLLHPKEEVGQLADTEGVRYVHGLEEGRRAYWCQVFVGEREVVRVGDGTSRFEVETRAAQEAVEKLLAEKRELNVAGDAVHEDMME